MCGPGVVFFGPLNTSDPPDAHKAKDQVQSILHQYIADFIHNEATDEQRAQSWTKNKSKAETVLRRLCGSTMMAKIIWEVGLPDISEARFAADSTSRLLHSHHHGINRRQAIARVDCPTSCETFLAL